MFSSGSFSLHEGEAFVIEEFHDGVGDRGIVTPAGEREKIEGAQVFLELEFGAGVFGETGT